MSNRDEEMMDCWGGLSSAISRACCAQPSEITEAIRDLEVERLRFEEVMSLWYAGKIVSNL